MSCCAFLWLWKQKKPNDLVWGALLQGLYEKREFLWKTRIFMKSENIYEKLEYL